MYFRFLPRHVYYALLRRAIGTGEGAGSGGRSPPRCFRFLDPFTLFQSEGTDYAHYITIVLAPTRFSHLPKALNCSTYLCTTYVFNQQVC